MHILCIIGIKKPKMFLLVLLTNMRKITNEVEFLFSQLLETHVIVSLYKYSIDISLL